MVKKNNRERANQLNMPAKQTTKGVLAARKSYLLHMQHAISFDTILSLRLLCNHHLQEMHLFFGLCVAR